MIKEAMILAGGQGTRLRPVIADVPKCMAPVNGIPFLHYLVEFLQKSGIEHFIFNVGYLHEVIREYLKENYSQLFYTFSLEKEPLGTGGAIRLGCSKASGKNVLICNGDTLYKSDIRELSTFHENLNATCTLSLKPMHYFDRYGVVELDEDHSVKTFKEKKYYTSGLINGGMYALNINKFIKEDLPEKFSFEKDYLEKNIGAGKDKTGIYGFIQDEYFIDIGIPEDYKRAQTEFRDF